MTDNLATIDEHTLIDQAVCDALGRSRDELMAMGLRTFFEAAMEAGYDVVVSSHRALDGEGHLSVSMGAPAPLHREG